MYEIYPTYIRQKGGLVFCFGGRKAALFKIGGTMKKDFRIITNNPLVREKLGQDYQVEFYECSYEDVLEKVKDEVYKIGRASRRERV